MSALLDVGVAVVQVFLIAVAWGLRTFDDKPNWCFYTFIFLMTLLFAAVLAGLWALAA